MKIIKRAVNHKEWNKWQLHRFEHGLFFPLPSQSPFQFSRRLLCHRHSHLILSEHYCPGVDLMLDHRRRRWFNIKSTLFVCVNIVTFKLIKRISCHEALLIGDCRLLFDSPKEKMQYLLTLQYLILNLQSRSYCGWLVWLTTFLCFNCLPFFVSCTLELTETKIFTVVWRAINSSWSQCMTRRWLKVTLAQHYTNAADSQ